ncbi:MAG: hypothetical protein EXR79_10235 [Myxococcales bacterium]|nr:hypothetical protein [Myxococcales bacterium]
MPPDQPSRWQFAADATAIDAADLLDLLKPLKSCHLTLVVESCFSGALADEIAQLPGVERLLTSQNRTTPSPMQEGDHPVGPASAAFAAQLQLSAGADMAGQVANAWNAGKTANTFNTDTSDPRKDHSPDAYAQPLDQKAKKKVFRAWPQSYLRNELTTPCPCCGNGVNEVGEDCDFGGLNPGKCPDGAACPKTCKCAMCTKDKDGTVKTESAPGKACSGTPVKTSFTITPNADGTHKLKASLGAKFSSATSRACSCACCARTAASSTWVQLAHSTRLFCWQPTARSW